VQRNLSTTVPIGLAVVPNELHVERKSGRVVLKKLTREKSSGLPMLSYQAVMFSAVVSQGEYSRKTPASKLAWSMVSAKLKRQYVWPFSLPVVKLTKS
jgi:hypothetical protein